MESQPKVPPKGTPERRQYDRQKKAESRDRLRAVRMAASIPTASDWMEQFPMRHPTQKTELDVYAKEFSKTVLSELQIKSSHPIDACLDQVARTLLGLKKGWLREVQAPAGQMVSGMYFPDALGSTIVHDSHRFEMERSPTFSAAYRELLAILDKKGHENTTDSVINNCARAIKAELDGTYSLPPELPIPSAPEPPTPEPPKLPTDREILERGRMQLRDQLQPFLSTEARNYLNGI